MFTAYLQTMIAAVVLLSLAGCGRQAGTGPDSGPLGRAEPVSGWPDTVNVSRAGRFYFAGQPSEAALRQAAAEGVGLVVNLRQDAEMATVPFDEPALAAELGMKYISIPVSPSTFSAAIVDRFAEAAAATERPVLVHCASSNRVGGLWAAYLVRRQGLAWEAALEFGRTAGLRTGMVEAAQRVAQDDEGSGRSAEDG